MNNTVRAWLGKSREELDEIYRHATPGNIPAGDTRGTAILAGSFFSKTVAAFARLLPGRARYLIYFVQAVRRVSLSTRLRRLV